MPQLLVVHHTTSPSLQALLEAVLAGTRAEGVEGVDVRVRPALTASPVDVLECDGFVLGSPVNIGYLSGALKHFFDGVYYPTLTAKPNAPYGLYLHGNDAASGALRAAASITKALGWVPAHEPVVVTGAPQRADTEAAWDLGATLAASLMPA